MDPPVHARSLTGDRLERSANRSRLRHHVDPRDLEAALGYAFSDRSLLTLALTHVGAAGQRWESYQRLEFLGDRVLGLACAEMVYRGFPEAEEGELSRRLAMLVRRESCAAVASIWGADAHIRLGPGERSSRALRQAVLGDICESIIGAVFVDGGIDAASALVRRSFEPQMLAPSRPLRDPKSALQEWAQAKGLAVPLYRAVGRSGPDHAPRFTVVACVEGHAEAEASGSSKRMAEQAAAAAFIERVGIGVRESQR